MLNVIDYSREDSRPVPVGYPLLDPAYHHCYGSLAETSCDLHWEITWDQIGDSLEEIAVLKEQEEVWAEWQAEVDYDLMIAEWEESHPDFWRSDIEDVGPYDDL